MTLTDTNRQADVAAIKNVLERLVEYWNSADGQAYGALFTADADYIDVTGNRTVGGEAIGIFHQFLFNGPLKGSKLEGNGSNELEVKFLAGDVALVIGGGNSRLEGQDAAPSDRASINTTVLVKREGRWLIRAFQNNRVTPYGKPPMPGKPE